MLDLSVFYLAILHLTKNNCTNKRFCNIGADGYKIPHHRQYLLVLCHFKATFQMTKSVLTIILPLTIFFISCGQTTNSNVVAAIKNDTLNIPSKIKMVTDSEPGEPTLQIC
jgi:hypothetical protein